jgi:hypothetical protein
MIAAIFIVTVGALGIFNLVNQTISLTSVSSSRLTAFYLTQEGIEIVRNIRDSNWLEGKEDPDILWDEGIPTGSWEADYRTQNLNQAYGGNYLNISDGLYSYSSGVQTKFKRKITISDKENLDEDEEGIPDVMKISVEVSWTERNISHQVTAQENIYRWH